MERRANILLLFGRRMCWFDEGEVRRGTGEEG